MGYSKTSDANDALVRAQEALIEARLACMDARLSYPADHEAAAHWGVLWDQCREALEVLNRRN